LIADLLAPLFVRREIDWKEGKRPDSRDTLLAALGGGLETTQHQKSVRWYWVVEKRIRELA
jgi:hypothetical protein